MKDEEEVKYFPDNELKGEQEKMKREREQKESKEIEEGKKIEAIEMK